MMKTIMESFRRYARAAKFNEAAYEGNLGFEELTKFYMAAPDDLTDKFEKAMEAGATKEAMAIVQDFLGVDLVGDEFERPAAAVAEAIDLDIEIGDIVLGGKYKNKRMEVKEIGEDELGQPTVNGKPILKFRIEKFLPDSKKSKKTLEAERAEEEE